MTVRELEPCLAHMLSLLSRHKFDKWLSSARTSRSKYESDYTQLLDKLHWCRTRHQLYFGHL